MAYFWESGNSNRFKARCLLRRDKYCSETDLRKAYAHLKPMRITLIFCGTSIPEQIGRIFDTTRLRPLQPFPIVVLNTNTTQSFTPPRGRRSNCTLTVFPRKAVDGTSAPSPARSFSNHDRQMSLTGLICLFLSDPPCIQQPANIRSGIRILPDRRDPVSCTSAPTASIVPIIVSRFEAIVIPSTGATIRPFSTQNPAAPRE